MQHKEVIEISSDTLKAEGWDYLKNVFNGKECWVKHKIISNMGVIEKYTYYPKENRVVVNNGGDMSNIMSFKVYNMEDIEQVITVVERR